jgi:hypothetical protein
MIDPRAGASAAGGAVEAALFAVAAPGRQDLAPPRVLPGGALDLIRVAAEDRPHADLLAARFGVDVRRIEDAALHFVHAVMFHPDSDHFRVLGVRPDDDDETLKLHFRWLQKWLHPDRDPEGWVSVYAERVNIAWAQLRRADRRAEYRERLGSLDAAPGPLAPVGLESAAAEPPFGTAPVAPILISSRWARRLPALVIGSGAVLVVALFAAHRVGENLLAAERSARERAEIGVVPLAQEPMPRSPAAAPEAVARPVGSLVPASAGSGVTAQDDPVAQAGDIEAPLAGEAQTGRPLPATLTATRDEAVAAWPGTGNATRADALPGATEPSPEMAVAQDSAIDRALRDEPMAKVDERGESRAGLAPSPREEPARPVVTAEPVAASSARPPLAIADGVPAQSTAQSPEPVGLAGAREVPAGSAEDLRPTAPTGPVAPGSPVDPSVGRRVLNQFSSAYRDGQVQDLVVLFAPNARTPEGNLVDLHQRYGSLFATSSRRSLEFIDLEWRALPNGLEGVGRYEWAMRPRGIGGTQATAGRMRVIIELVDGRPLIVLLDQQDVG